MTPRAVAFDLDGLLIDSEPMFLEAARRLLVARNIAFDPAFMHTIMGMPGRDVLPRFKTHFDLAESVEQIGEAYKRHFFEATGGLLIPLKRGALELIQRLKSVGSCLALATSSRRLYVDSVFGPHGLLPEFDHVLTCDDVDNGKPAPDVYWLAAKRIGVESANMIVFEDSPAGVRAAKSAGCYCIAVPQPHTPHEKVADADLIVPALDDARILSLMGL